MERVPGMLMIGSAGRNAGKTEFACRIIRRLSATVELTGLKVTTVKQRDGTCPRGGRGCGVCSSLKGDYCLTEETGENPAKDTARLLAAGAKRVFWLRVMKDRLTEGLAAVRKAIGPGRPVICESNSLRSVAEPDLFLMVGETSVEGYKPSAADVRDLADREVLSDGRGFSPDPAEIGLADGRWTLREDACAVILAGGGSRRMGRDKCLLPVGGRPMIEHIYRQLAPNFREVLISCGQAGRYSFVGAREVPDEVPDEGPLMGILSALGAARNDLCAVVACDMPEIGMPALRRLLRLVEGFDAVVPLSEGGRREPLFAVYRRSVLSAARAALAAGRRRVDSIYESCRVNFVQLDPVSFPHNINTAEDYDRFIGGA